MKNSRLIVSIVAVATIAGTAFLLSRPYRAAPLAPEGPSGGEVASDGVERGPGYYAKYHEEFLRELSTDERAIVEKAPPDSAGVLAASFCLAATKVPNARARDAVVDFLQSRKEPEFQPGSKAPAMDANIVSALGALAQAAAKHDGFITSNSGVLETAVKYSSRTDLIERTAAAMVLWMIMAQSPVPGPEVADAYKRSVEDPALRSLLQRQLRFLGSTRTKAGLPALQHDGLSTAEAR